VRWGEAGIGLATDHAERGCKIMGTGDMGIGNTTPSAAIAAVMTGTAVADVTGRGTGISDEALARKIGVIETAIRINAPDPADGLDVLAKVGGCEIGAIAGLVLGAAARRVPVVIDGFISAAGAIIAHRMQPLVADYIFAAHSSVEKGHAMMIRAMGIAPILDLGLGRRRDRGGPAMLMIEGGLKIYNEMATFEDAGVTGRT
jgi:nicotinate-nucleotide--dimethylbenzimidazole phosphoribosyltransferase